mgnify:FL=1
MDWTRTLERIFEWMKKTVLDAYEPPMKEEPVVKCSPHDPVEPELVRFVADARAIIEHYTDMANGRVGNAAYTTSAGNMGSDMLRGIDYATRCLVSVRLINDYEANCLNVSKAIEVAREAFEANYDDSEGFGTGTLGQIGFDIKKLVQEEDDTG